MEIRPANTNDLSALSELFDAYRQFYEQPGDRDAARQFIGDRLEAGDSTILVAEESGHLAGFVQLYPSFTSVGMQKIFILNDLFVSATARGKGVGDQLMAAAESYGRESGAKHLELATAIDNEQAQALYVKRGWSADNEFLHYSKGL